MKKRVLRVLRIWNAGITSLDEGFITQEEYEKGRTLISKALALLNGYIKYLSRQKDRIANDK